ncbi:tRNA-uridine aminocarboxypropyltransferase [Motilimonas eburnea]|uniref:tRNA-uridine aminocarboxypropyltransferase n=1 Tax=Motilimonas eburnea TaxID=1737488 RepID=UPI001E3A31DE|nr:tRNA-uridine aminocarboxypropyltransferase [Motilimonas eburnea]MCE2572543.1 DTW domain-containing protein [Motilimonas eburnea]
MSQRPWCVRCNKAQVACICQLITTINNQYKLLILQHPSEANKAVGSARILSLSLTNSELICSETLPLTYLEAAPTYLLYPSTEPVVSARSGQFGSNSQFILLDGSWKKAFRLLQLNPALQQLPKVGIEVKQPSQYRIRKSTKSQGVSSVEAGFYLMSQLEGSESKFTSLLSAFDAMIDFQLQQMPPSVRRERYK